MHTFSFNKPIEVKIFGALAIWQSKGVDHNSTPVCVVITVEYHGTDHVSWIIRCTQVLGASPGIICQMSHSQGRSAVACSAYYQPHHNNVVLAMDIFTPVDPSEIMWYPKSTTGNHHQTGNDQMVW